MSSKQTLQPSPVDLAHLDPPPDPWRLSASTGSLYLLGDVEQLGADAVADYVNSHPLIAIKIGRKRYVVVGLYRSWELLQTHAHRWPGYFKTVPVFIKSAPEEAIPRIAGETYFWKTSLDPCLQSMPFHSLQISGNSSRNRAVTQFFRLSTLNLILPMLSLTTREPASPHGN